MGRLHSHPKLHQYPETSKDIYSNVINLMRYFLSKSSKFILKKKKLIFAENSLFDKLIMNGVVSSVFVFLPNYLLHVL